jgi:neutral ceramidase
MLDVGRGIADITGEAADCGMLGYGKARQRTTGIHLRLRARAFVFADSRDPACRRVLLVVAELPLPMQSVTDEVLRRLDERFGDTYRDTNTMITTTHTHCGPGGYSGHALYNMTTGGFRPKTFEAIVAGIVEAVQRAHDDLAPSDVTVGRGELHDASSNRSPTAFARNPDEERSHFPGGIDPLTTTLRIDRGDRTVGMINFFATHGTSMSNRNTLISSDNKGYAAYHWERVSSGIDYLAPDSPAVVAAFAQTNTGDMSPNLNHRPGSGPTEDEVENTRLIGLRQYTAAAAACARADTPLGAGVDSRATYVDLGDVAVRPEFTGDGRSHRTGRPTMAAAAVAGTDEGRGFRGFRQGSNPVWAVPSSLAYRFDAALRDAHAPKAILAPGSLLNARVPFVQEVVPVQLIRLGRLYLIGIPGEVTVVAGLRLRRTVAAVVGADLDDVLVVGYSNAYIHYVTTPEEYDEQRYEGGSTLFGRWELPALQQTVADLATAMRDGRDVEAGPRPRPGRLVSRLRERPPDDAGTFSFGAVRQEPAARYRTGDVVTVAFVSAYPNNDLRRGDTFLEVQRETADGWLRVADDGDWATTMRWRRRGRSGSEVTVRWTVPTDAEAGSYRIVHHGSARSAAGTLTPFHGTSRTFVVAG